jgi:hypothetical protein
MIHLFGAHPETEFWMLYGYFDDDPETKRLRQLTLGGCVAPRHTWKELCADWADFLSHWPGLEWFHMSDFESYSGAFRDKLGWNKDNPEHRERHRKMLNEVIDLIARHIRNGFGITIFFPPENGSRRRNVERTRYKRVYQNGAIDTIYHAGRYAGALGDDISIVFGSNAQAGFGKVEAHFGEFQLDDPRLRSIESARTKDEPGLQVADLIAYELSRRERNQEEGFRRYPLKRLIELGVIRHWEWRDASRRLDRRWHLKE